jgi:hypothetical protein
MLKLYKRSGASLHYHEAWESEGNIIEHWGVVGDRGDQRSQKIRRGLSEEEAIESVLQKSRADGFEEIDLSDHATILIVYPVLGMGSPKDLEKRHALEDRMNETLGWTGLGNCDGGSIGSGTMEACCMVVDAEVAKRVIADDLKSTPFADYAEIIEE